jgi:hypothetical protein
MSSDYEEDQTDEDGVTGFSPPQEIRPPSQKGGDIPRIFAPPYKFWIFDLKTKRLQV